MRPREMRYQFLDQSASINFFSEAYDMIGQVGSFNEEIIDVNHDDFGTLIFGSEKVAMEYFKSFTGLQD